MGKFQSQNEVRWLLNDKYGGKEVPKFWCDLRRLQNGEPVDYVIGWTPFLGCKIDLSLHPFIPRPETEYWVKNAIDEIRLHYGDKPLRILDIFAGSGCIGIAILKHLPDATVYFADIDSTALKQIELNLSVSNILSDRARIIKSDIFKDVSGRFDIIFANPPYVPLARICDVARSVHEYEPQSAIFGGIDGLNIIRLFIRYARQYLNPGGSIWMEFDPYEKDKLSEIINACGYTACEFMKDQFGKWRTVKLMV